MLFRPKSDPCSVSPLILDQGEESSANLSEISKKTKKSAKVEEAPKKEKKEEKKK